MILNYIHIGKCGGGSITRTLKNSKLINQKFSKVTKTHCVRPLYNSEHFYLISIRHPIERALSAFNWRYHLVVETGVRKNQIEGEANVLFKYHTLSNIAENLYADAEGEAVLNKRTAKEFNTIHHLKQNIHFYLGTILKQSSPDQIYGVIKQHSIQSDCSKLLGVNEIMHHKKREINPESLSLSSLAKKNLTKFLAKDFKCISKLLELDAISLDDYEKLTRAL